MAIRKFVALNLKQPQPVPFKTEAYTLVSLCKKKRTYRVSLGNVTSFFFNLILKIFRFPRLSLYKHKIEACSRNHCYRTQAISINTFAASYLNTQGLNNSCLKSTESTLVDLTFQSRALRSFSLNQLRNLSL